MAGKQAATARHSAARLAAFSAISLPVAAASMPVTVLVPQLYASGFGLSLVTIGFVFFLGRFWDVAADPLVGMLSDRTDNRFGRRRTWIAAGGLLFGLSTILLFFPSRAFAGPGYLGLCLFLFYLAWSMIEIPSSAWAGELAGDYHERTRTLGYQAWLRSIGLLLILILPTVIDQFAPGNVTLKLAVMGSFILAALLPALALTLFAIPESPAPPRSGKRTSLLKTGALIFTDRLLLRVLATDTAVTAGQSIRGGLVLFFVVWYMGLPAWASGLYLIQFVFGVAAAPIWMRVGRRFGKRRAAIAGELAQAAINLSILFVMPGMLPLLIALTVAQGLTQSSGNLMLRSMVADVADAHRLRTGEDRTGLFYSVFALSAKLGPAIGIGVALPLVGWLGFAPKPGNSQAALDAVKYIFALGPAAAHLLAIAIIGRFPLNELEHAEIRAALNAKEMRRG